MKAFNMLSSWMGHKQQSHMVDTHFAAYMTEQGKSYLTVEEFIFRQALFQDVDNELKRINADETITHEVEHNFMSDWTKEEKKKLLGYKNIHEYMLGEKYEELPTDNIADAVDWRTKGAVTPIKN